MSIVDPDRKLLDVALQVADGADVDWGRALEESPQLGDSLTRLQRVASVVSSFGGLVDAPEEPAAAFSWGPLRVLRRLGGGSFGEVFTAWDPALRREVALKLRRTNTARGAMLWLEEARRLARVRHPNVVAVYGADIHDDRAGLWTELLEGRTLEELLAAQGPLGAREAALIGLDLCAALAAVHATGLIHGDVKASNVMRVGAASAGPGTSGRIVLMDFGSSHDGGSGLAMGTPLSAPPELLSGALATRAADIYSLGALLFLLVTGRHRVQAQTLEELRTRHARGEYLRLRDVRPDLPHAFVDAIERATCSDPAQRIASAAEMESALAAVVAPSARTPRRARTRVLLVAAGSLVLAAVALLGPWRRPNTRVASGATATPSPRPEVAQPPAGAVPTPTSLEIESVLFREEKDERTKLATGDRVIPGDRLTLEIASPEDVRAFVFDEDEHGNVYTLFPMDADAQAPVLMGGARHVLPTELGGRALDWEVTSAGGRETILIVATRRPMPLLENAARSFRRVGRGESPARPGQGAQGGDVELRGIGAVAPRARSETSARESRLATLARALSAQRSRYLWSRLIVLENP